MLEIEILATGEVRSLDSYIGQITWTYPFADADGVGTWVRESECECVCDREAAHAEALAALKGDGRADDRNRRAIEILEAAE